MGRDCQHRLPVQGTRNINQSGCILCMDDLGVTHKSGNGHAFPKKGSHRRKLKTLGVCLKSGHLVHPGAPALGAIGGC